MSTTRRQVTTNAERVAASQQRAIARGGKRVSVILRPDEARALRHLMKGRYSDTVRGTIGKALIEAVRRNK